MSVFLLWFTSPTPTPSIFNMIFPPYNAKDDIKNTIPSPTDTSSHKLPQALTTSRQTVASRQKDVKDGLFPVLQTWGYKPIHGSGHLCQGHLLVNLIKNLVNS